MCDTILKAENMIQKSKQAQMFFSIFLTLADQGVYQDCWWHIWIPPNDKGISGGQESTDLHP